MRLWLGLALKPVCEFSVLKSLSLEVLLAGQAGAELSQKTRLHTQTLVGLPAPSE